MCDEAAKCVQTSCQSSERASPAAAHESWIETFNSLASMIIRCEPSKAFAYFGALANCHLNCIFDYKLHKVLHSTRTSITSHSSACHAPELLPTLIMFTAFLFKPERTLSQAFCVAFDGLTARICIPIFSNQSNLPLHLQKSQRRKNKKKGPGRAEKNYNLG